MSFSQIDAAREYFMGILRGIPEWSVTVLANPAHAQPACPQLARSCTCPPSQAYDTGWIYAIFLTS